MKPVKKDIKFLNAAIHLMDLYVKKNATVLGKDRDHVKDVFFLQKVNYESKSVCYVSH